MDAIDGQPATAPMIAPGAASRRDHTAAILSSSTAHDSSGAPADRGGASRAADESEGGVLLRGGAHSLMYRTLRYVLLSNRLTLHELDGPQRLAVRSKIQFAVLQADPEREIAFRSRREALGSFFAFHGAQGDCWYSIMRNSLRNLSNSALMRHGAAHGA